MKTIEHTASHHRARFSRDIDMYRQTIVPHHIPYISSANSWAQPAFVPHTKYYSVQYIEEQRVHYFITYNLYVPLKIK